MGYVRNLVFGMVQNPKNWKILLFSHYFNVIGHNNETIETKNKYFPVFGVLDRHGT